MSELRQKFLTSIVHAGGAAATGNKKEMERYIKEARGHHKVHISDFAKSNASDEVDAENKACNDYYGKVMAILDGSFRKKKI
jgi:hypothetical protein